MTSRHHGPGAGVHARRQTEGGADGVEETGQRSNPSEEAKAESAHLVTAEGLVDGLTDAGAGRGAGGGSRDVGALLGDGSTAGRRSTGARAGSSAGSIAGPARRGLARLTLESLVVGKVHVVSVGSEDGLDGIGDALAGRGARRRLLDLVASADASGRLRARLGVRGGRRGDGIDTSSVVDNDGLVCKKSGGSANESIGARNENAFDGSSAIKEDRATH